MYRATDALNAIVVGGRGSSIGIGGFLTGGSLAPCGLSSRC